MYKSLLIFVHTFQMHLVGLKAASFFLKRSHSNPNPHSTKTSTTVRDQSLTLIIFLLHLLKLNDVRNITTASTDHENTNVNILTTTNAEI